MHDGEMRPDLDALNNICTRSLTVASEDGLITMALIIATALMNRGEEQKTQTVQNATQFRSRRCCLGALAEGKAYVDMAL